MGKAFKVFLAVIAIASTAALFGVADAHQDKAATNYWHDHDNDDYRHYRRYWRYNRDNDDDHRHYRYRPYRYYNWGGYFPGRIYW